ncbi:hypothetical protein HELRODRAFT_82857 [Helobdella robusta]|uniref:Proline dehydrogenase n=1 Tax=Helobdella robusta TaxID=6412 RepID=T1G4X5_HELRO|nr:hypothetical protein HELRODRAFT_82857 [Helobdella robusta]ESO00677.1 hypothetical protein HELRODRAFT_82857 [Helobdella robusta]
MLSRLLKQACVVRRSHQPSLSIFPSSYFHPSFSIHPSITIHPSISIHSSSASTSSRTPSTSQSALRTLSTSQSAVGFDDPAIAKLDPSFNNPQEAFRSKTNFELIRGYLVFQLCSINYLVDNNKKVMKLARKLVGKNLFEKIMKASFYGQFVAGEDAERIKPVVERNMSFGVKSILDYSAEKDNHVEEARTTELKIKKTNEEKKFNKNKKADDKKFSPSYEFGDRREHVISARTYFYEDEKQCDENMQHFIRGIDAVSGATNATGFAAVKLTALGRPQFLLQLSEVLVRVRRYFDTLAQCYGTGTVTKQDFERHLKSFNLDQEETQRWFTVLDCTKDGSVEIDLLDWHNLLEVNVSLAKLLRVPNLRTGKLEPLVKHLTDVEEEQMKNMLHRIDKILKYAESKDVRVMIDAEQTYFQAAISRLCMEMMRKYNGKKATVFNTYQCYLKDAHNLLCNDLALSKREDFYFGAKLVRGAYIDQEKLRAQTLGYEDPINPSYEATSQMFEKTVGEVMRSINERPKGKIAVMMATHNEDTVRMVLKKMQEYEIKSTDKLICFGQLYGMCDQISFSLGQAGYSVYKYVPYGPVEEVIPYLSRRAIENRGILAKVKKEKKLLRSEIWRRFWRLKWFYKPPRPDILKQHQPQQPHQPQLQKTEQQYKSPSSPSSPRQTPQILRSSAAPK